MEWVYVPAAHYGFDPAMVFWLARAGREVTKVYKMKEAAI